MRLNALYNLVFNRKNKKLAPTDVELIQVEIFPVNDSKKYIGTGIYITEEQWDKDNKIIVNHPVAAHYNQRLTDFISDLQKFEMSIINQGRMMDREDINLYLGRTVKKDRSFTQYMREQINKRKDIVEAVRGKHEAVADELEEFGIKDFTDLTYNRIKEYDAWLHEKNYAQPTIHKRHATIKVYIHRAEKDELFPYGKNPYLKISVPRGKHKIRTRLDDDELEKLTAVSPDDPDLVLARDLYLFQCYTGVSYKDLRNLSWKENIRNNEDGVWIEGLRKKNGEYYTVYLIPEAMDLITKYKVVDRDKLFETPDVGTQNDRLKLIAFSAGISKNVTTHTGRHTCATLLLRRGASIDYIRDILGHVSSKTTEVYAKIEKPGIRQQMLKISKK